jgi:TonB family protein
MSAEAEIKPVGAGPPNGTFSGVKWSRKKIFVFIVFMFVAHLGFIFLFGTKKNPAPRSPDNVPHFQIVNDSAGLVALDDPTLFAQPHIEDFAPAVWRQMPKIEEPTISWGEAPPFLTPDVEWFGAAFNSFMTSNRFAKPALNFKPAPQLSAPAVQIESMLPQRSTVQIGGDISRRPLNEAINAPTLAYNDVIAPSRVQVLVGAGGEVASVALLDSSGYDMADLKALELARRARFAPAKGLAFGEMIFNWHTVPVLTTNAP